MMKQGGQLYSVAAGVGLLFLGTFDHIIRVWDIVNPNYPELATLKGHTGSISALAVCEKTQRLFSGSWDNTIKIWDLSFRNSRLKYPEKACLSGHADVVSTLIFDSASGRLFSGSWDKTIRIWNVGHALAVASSSGGGGATNSKLNYAQSGCLRAHSGYVRSLAIHEGFLFSGSNDQTIRVWDISGPGDSLDGTDSLTTRMQPDDTPSISYSVINSSSSGKQDALVVFDGSVSLDMYLTGSLRNPDSLSATQPAADVVEVACLTGHTDSVLCLAANEGRLYSGSKDGSIRVWDILSIFKSTEGEQNPLQSLDSIRAGGRRKIHRACDDLSSSLAVGSSLISVSTATAAADEERLLLHGNSSHYTQQPTGTSSGFGWGDSGGRGGGIGGGGGVPEGALAWLPCAAPVTAIAASGARIYYTEAGLTSVRVRETPSAATSTFTAAAKSRAGDLNSTTAASNVSLMPAVAAFGEPVGGDYSAAGKVDQQAAVVITSNRSFNMSTLGEALARAGGLDCPEVDIWEEKEAVGGIFCLCCHDGHLYSIRDKTVYAHLL